MKKKLKTYTSNSISAFVAYVEMLLTRLARVWFLMGLLLLALPSFAGDITFAKVEKEAKNFFLERSSESDCPDNIIFTSQAQIDNFTTDYPGCTEILGSVRITESIAGDITNLDGLSQIQSIGLGLWISSNQALVNLSGLDHLTTIGDILWIDNNPALASLSGLDNLVSVAGNFSLFANPSLINLSGLGSLQELGGNLLITNNLSLVGLDGISNLSSIDGYLFVSDNPVLENLTGLEQVTSIMGTISIIGNSSLTSLNGIQNINPLTVQSPLKIYMNPNLSSCEVQVVCDYLGMSGNATVIHSNAAGCNTAAEIEAACTQSCPNNLTFTSQQEIDDFSANFPSCVHIMGNLTVQEANIGNITDLSGLAQIQSVEGVLRIEHNNALVNLNGLDNISSVGSLLIGVNPSLTSIAQLSGITTLDNLTLAWNEKLMDFTGLNNIATAYGDVQIHYTAVESLSGLSSLSSVGGLFIILGNSNLTNLNGLQNLTSIGERLFIVNNASLVNLNGLDNLVTVAGNFTVRVNSSLSSLSGLENLTSIGGFFYVGGNPLLTNLIGLNGLNSVGDYFRVDDAALVNFNGLEALQEIGTDVSVFNTDIVNFTGLEGLSTIGGNLYIDSNNNLVSLNGIQNIDPTSIQYITIINNNNLSECSILSICEYFGLSGMFANVYGNATGCNTIPEIEDACGQGCPTDITLSSQQQIDDFATDYPGCTSISGYLRITETIDGNILNLNGLSQIESIGDYLYVNSNDALTNLSGLESLNYIGGALVIIDNDGLTSLQGLTNLNSTLGPVVVNDNEQLTSLQGLENITSIHDYLEVLNNPNLLNFNGLDNGQSISGGVNVGYNTSLVNLAGLENLVSVGGNFIIQGCDNLTSLSGLEQLTSIGSYLVIYDNDLLLDLDGLSGLQSIGGFLHITENDLLNNISGIQNIDPVTIHSNSNNHLDLEIYNNPNLSACSVQSICEFLGIFGVTTDVHDNAIGCNSVTDIESACTPICPTNLVFSTQHQIDAFPTDYPFCIDIPNILVTSGVIDPILNLDGFAQLNSIGGNLTLAWNDHLGSMEGLSNVTTVGGDIVVRASEPLASLTGLEGITSIGGFIGIYNNGNLSDIEALQNIDPNSIEALDITGNTSLSNCSIQSICDYLDLPSQSTTIENNATGCNSVAEVEMACSPSTECEPIVGFTSLGMFNGHTYYLSNFEKNWRQAQLIAIQEECYIASITTQAENDFIQSFLGNSIVLIGLNDDNIEEQLVWDSGEPVTLDLSYGNTIDNDFAVMNFWDGSWEMVNQWVAKRFVLEKDCSSSESSSMANRSKTTKYRSVVVCDVYPNPADDWLTIRVTNDKEKQAVLYVYDGLGRLVLSENRLLVAGNSELELDISKLHTGLYHIQFEGESSYMNFMKME